MFVSRKINDLEFDFSEADEGQERSDDLLCAAALSKVTSKRDRQTDRRGRKLHGKLQTRGIKIVYASGIV